MFVSTQYRPLTPRSTGGLGTLGRHHPLIHRLRGAKRAGISPQEGRFDLRPVKLFTGHPNT